MSTTLQVGLFAVCVAVVSFVILMIPLTILLYRRSIDVSRQLKELNTELKGLVQDSRTMVQNINSVSIHVNEQMDELDGIIGIIKRWLERSDHVVEEIGATVEVPLRTVARGIKGFYQAWRFIERMVGQTSRQTDLQDEPNCGTRK